MLRIETIAKNFKFSGHFKYARAYMRIGRYAPECALNSGKTWLTVMKLIDSVSIRCQLLERTRPNCLNSTINALEAQ